jgi:hypothetical protein
MSFPLKTAQKKFMNKTELSDDRIKEILKMKFNLFYLQMIVE